MDAMTMEATAAPIRRTATYRGEAPHQGRGQRPLRELLTVIALHSDGYASRVDGGEWRRRMCDHPMLHGSPLALADLGIAAGERIEQTDSPVRFDVTGADGARRTIELAWDSMSDDLMSLPPHVKPAHPAVRAFAWIGGAALSWGLIALAVRHALAG